jgi:hypothetical protein
LSRLKLDGLEEFSDILASWQEEQFDDIAMTIAVVGQYRKGLQWMSWLGFESSIFQLFKRVSPLFDDIHSWFGTQFDSMGMLLRAEARW